MEDTEHTNEQAADRANRSGRAMRWGGILLVGTAVLLAFYGIVAYLAWQNGEAQRVAFLEATREYTISRQVELAAVDVDNGNYELAQRRLDYVLDRDANAPEAADLYAQAQTRQALALTPTATATQTPMPTQTPTPDPTAAAVADNEVAADELAVIEELVDERRWIAAIEALTTFRADHPNYQRRITDELLYTAYVGQGLRLTRGNSDQIESGLYYLNQAQALGDLTDEVEGEMFWAEQYLEGIVFYGINWPAYLSYFGPMCDFAPLFQNSCELYREGLLRYGDQLAQTLDWCPAAEQYRLFLAYANEGNDEVAQKKLTADEMCLTATPTPAVITGTIGVTNTGVVPPALTPDP